MSTGPAVIVNKGGFLAAVAKGVFGTIMVCVFCATALGLYALHIADQGLGPLARQVVSALPEWQKAMPPVIADALNDHRAPDYRTSLAISARVIPADDEPEEGLMVLEIKNKGDQTVSLLPLRLVIENPSGDRMHDVSLLAAAPLSVGDSYGPLLPGTERLISRHVRHVAGQSKVAIEITDLRVWNGPVAAATESAPHAPAEDFRPLPPGGTHETTPQSAARSLPVPAANGASD